MPRWAEVIPSLTRALARSLAAIGVVVLAIPAAVSGASPAGAHTPTAPVGTVLSSQKLPTRLWIPGTRAAWKLTYVSTDAHHYRAVTSGTVFIPRGTPPKGGWPVISWAHGTSGLADACAPSAAGPSEPERDRAYLKTWMGQGYAVVATDYAGLGTGGLPAYLNGASEAHNIVDMVKAGRAFADRGPTWRHLGRRFMVLGQSQGGGAAVYTARYATAYAGAGLDYRGTVATGAPANMEKVLLLMAPDAPPVALVPSGITSYIAYLLASLQATYPDLGIHGALTAAGRRAVAQARTMCVGEFVTALKGVNLGDWFRRPLATLPHFYATVRDYMAMPTTGFDKPFFMANGLLDTDVPIAITLPYVLQLEATGQPVSFHTYLTDHSGTMAASLKDSIPFAAKLMR